MANPADPSSAKPDALTWDDTYMLAQALTREHRHANLPSLGLETINRWVLALPEFADDPAPTNDAILLSIVGAWYEESDSR